MLLMYYDAKRQKELLLKNYSFLSLRSHVVRQHMYKQSTVHFLIWI